MAAIIGTVTFSIVIVLSILLVCGLPLGELTMGGQFPKVLPKKLRLVAASQLLVQIFAVVILLQSGGYLPLWFSAKATRIICYVFAVYLTVNVPMNAISRSKKERYIMTPLSLVTAVCFWITACQA